MTDKQTFRDSSSKSSDNKGEKGKSTEPNRRPGELTNIGKQLVGMGKNPYDYDALRRTLTPRSEKDILPSEGELTREEKKELKYAKYRKKEERMNAKYENYDHEIKKMRGTVHRPERKIQIDNDSDLLSKYINSIQKAFKIIMSTLPREQRSKLKEELRSLIDANEPKPNTLEDVLAGYHNLFSSVSSDERDTRELKYAHEMVGKRLTLIKELRNMAIRYIAESDIHTRSSEHTLGSSDQPQMPDPKEHGGRLPRTGTGISLDSEGIIGHGDNRVLQMPDPKEHGGRLPRTGTGISSGSESLKTNQPPNIKITLASPIQGGPNSFGSISSREQQLPSSNLLSELGDTSHPERLPKPTKSYRPYRKTQSPNSDNSLNTSPFSSNNSSLSELGDTSHPEQSPKPTKPYKPYRKTVSGATSPKEKFLNPTQTKKRD